MKFLNKYTKFFYLLIASIYLGLVLFFFFPSKKYPSWDTIPNILLPISFLNEGNLDFNEFREGKIKVQQSKLDEKTAYDAYYFTISEKTGDVLSSYPLMSGILAIPFVKLISFFNQNILNIDSFFHPQILQLGHLVAVIVTLINVFAVYYLINLKTKNNYLAITISLLFIFATEVISISSKFLWQHTFSLLLITIIIIMYEQKKIVATAFFVFLASLVRPAVLVMLVPFLFQLLLENLKNCKKSLKVNLFDKLFKKRQLYKFISKFKLKFIYLFLILAVILFFFSYSRHYFNANFVLATHYQGEQFSGNIAFGLLGSLLSPSRGLLIFSPIFIFAFWEIFKRRKIKEDKPYLIALISFLLLIAKYKFWWGGWSHGYRMLMDLLPILILYLAFYLKSWHSFAQGHKLFICILISISIFIQSFLGAHYYDCGWNYLPKDIMSLDKVELRKKIWGLDSEIYRCLNQIQEM
ncbi:MAG: hypothetical protein PVJ09_02610 [Candidatus Woesebacteria bacterium]|jgi:hypothetical protein